MRLPTAAGLLSVLPVAVVGCSGGPARVAGIAGQPSPQLGVALVGDGRLAATVDAYGQLTDLYWPRPGERAQIVHPTDGGSLADPDGLGVGIEAGVPGRRLRPLCMATAVRQRYLGEMYR